MKSLVGAFNQEKALLGAFSVIVQPVVEPMDHFTALHVTRVTAVRHVYTQVLTALLAQLHLPPPGPAPCPAPAAEQRAVVPYDGSGRRSDTARMWLDLSRGQRIRLHPDHNCQVQPHVPTRGQTELTDRQTVS